MKVGKIPVRALSDYTVEVANRPIRGTKDLCFSMSLAEALFINPSQKKREELQVQA
jgi:hypothetical protein